MTDQELDRLAALIADALLASRDSHDPPSRGQAGTWLPTPVRPEPPSRGGEPPVWSGAAQLLADVAPTPRGSAAEPRARVSTAALTRATPAAAAGRDVVDRPDGRRAAPGWRSRPRGDGTPDV